MKLSKKNKKLQKQCIEHYDQMVKTEERNRSFKMDYSGHIWKRKNNTECKFCSMRLQIMDLED